jgi:hypothetical protein
MADKKPICRWKPYQTARPTIEDLNGWFDRRNADLGIAVIFGAISGGLASRDFDDMGSYTRWAASHADLAERLPRVATFRGMHVYCTARQEQVAEIRARIRKPEGIGAIKCTDGELRVGIGCYSVLPPSRHPKGGFYRWDLPLPAGALPVVDLVEAGFTSAIDASACNRDTQRATEAMTSVHSGDSVDSDYSGDSDISVDSGVSGHSVLSGISGDSALSGVSVPLCCMDWSDEIERAIVESLPTGPGRRNEQVFALARALKAVPGVSEATAKDCKPFVQRWHELAEPVIMTKPFEETWIDFLRAWPKVKFAKGAEPVTIALKVALNSEEPKIAAQFEQEQLRLLVGLCRELQRSAGSNPFFLSCRTAGRLLDVDHSTAWRWLFLLVAEGVLRVAVQGGNVSQKATRYQYLGDW